MAERSESAAEPVDSRWSPAQRRLWVAGAALAALALTLLVGRDGFVVPLVAGNLQDIGDFWVFDGFWTPAVNAAAGLAGAVSVGLGAWAARTRT